MCCGSIVDLNHRDSRVDNVGKDTAGGTKVLCAVRFEQEIPVVRNVPIVGDWNFHGGTWCYRNRFLSPNRLLRIAWRSSNHIDWCFQSLAFPEFTDPTFQVDGHALGSHGVCSNEDVGFEIVHNMYFHSNARSSGDTIDQAVNVNCDYGIFV